MRKTFLKVGVALMVLVIFIRLIFIWESALFLTYPKSNFEWIPAVVVFALGFICTILSLIFIFRAKRVAAAYKSQLQPEGIVLFEEDVKGSMTFRDFRRPGVYDGWRKVLITSLVVLTRKRLLALKGASPIIDVPLTDERLKQMKFSLEGETTMLVAFEANLFQSEWSGEIEYRFKTAQAREFLQKLSEITK